MQGTIHDKQNSKRNTRKVKWNWVHMNRNRERNRDPNSQDQKILAIDKRAQVRKSPLRKKKSQFPKQPKKVLTQRKTQVI